MSDAKYKNGGTPKRGDRVMADSGDGFGAHPGTVTEVLKKDMIGTVNNITRDIKVLFDIGGEIGKLHKTASASLTVLQDDQG